MKNNLFLARKKRRAMVELGEPLTLESNLILKSKAYPTSKVKAIAAFCFHCNGGTAKKMPDPGWREGIKDCTSRDCPLYNHRPYKPKDGEED
jgi:hypothetical protein